MSRVRTPSPAPSSPFRFQRRTLTVAVWVVLPAVLSAGAFELPDPRRSGSGRRQRSSEKVGPRPQKPGGIDPSEDVSYAIGAAQCTEMDHANGQPTLSVTDLGGPIGLGRTADVTTNPEAGGLNSAESRHPRPGDGRQPTTTGSSALTSSAGRTSNGLTPRTCLASSVPESTRLMRLPRRLSPKAGS